ncbi:helix-turn-helix domain-containing protein [Paenibacillus ginsengarvi]|nr:helix-turn-helix domain-containing protein [Paenibacillus ginsengarvi]
MLAQMDFIFHAMREARSYMPMHRHRCYELVYYREGTGSTRLHELEYRYEPNTYTVIPPGMMHDERRFCDTDVVFIGFSQLGRDMPVLTHGLFQDAPSSPILRLLLDIKTEMQEKKAYYGQKLNLRLSEMLIEHARSVSPVLADQTDDNLLYARTFMDENLGQKIAVEDLAALAGYSYDHFRHLFKKKFGVSPIQYLIDKRLEKARSLLRHTSLPVTSVALECGFSSDAQFCTMFKRELGETPRAFRQNSYRSL